MSSLLTTTHRRASPWAMNQHATSNPTARRIVMMVNQSLRPHHRVRRKQTPTIMLATLLATTLKPAKINRAPIIDDPRYPAGRVMALMPPCMWVTPPSCGSSEIDLTFPPVQQEVMACPNSWNAMTSI